MRKLKLLFLFVTICIANQSIAQKRGQALIDSLITQLRNAKEDSNKVNLLNDICYAYLSMNPDEGIKYGMEGLELAEKINWKKGIAAANSRIGINYGFGKSDYPKALEYYLKSLKLTEELGNKKGTAGNLHNIGAVYNVQSNYLKALEYYFKAVKMNKERGDKDFLARNFTAIGSVYNAQHDYPNDCDDRVD